MQAKLVSQPLGPAAVNGQVCIGIHHDTRGRPLPTKSLHVPEPATWVTFEKLCGRGDGRQTFLARN